MMRIAWKPGRLDEPKEAIASRACCKRACESCRKLSVRAVASVRVRAVKRLNVRAVESLSVAAGVDLRYESESSEFTRERNMQVTEHT
eukprot:1551352-Pleurochrysis_carterae.AAC.1